MNIKKIEIYSESGNIDNTIQKAIVYYEDGHHEDPLSDIDDIIMAISRFATYKKMTFDELKNDKEKLVVIPLIKLEKPEAKKEEPKKEETKEEDSKKGDHKEKESKTKDEDDDKNNSRRLKAWILAALTSVAIGWEAMELLHNNKTVSMRTGTPRRTITQEIKTPPVEDNGSKFLENLHNRVVNDELYYNVQDYLSGVNKTEDNLTWILNDISNKCQANIEQMNRFIDGESMTGDKFTLMLSNMFEDNDINHAVTKKFEDMCNDIRNKCFEGKRDEAISAYRNFYNLFIDFVYCDVPMNVNGRDVRYYDNDINAFARDYIMVMGQVLMEANINDYSAMIGNSVYKIDKLRTFVSSTYVNLVDILYESVSRTK